MLKVPPPTPLSPDRASKVTAIGVIGAMFFGVLALRYVWSLLNPGTLTISADGITQNLGWRRRHWNWGEIDKVELGRTAGNLVGFCMLYPVASLPVRLFGWQLSAGEIYDAIEETRAKYAKVEIS